MRRRTRVCSITVVGAGRVGSTLALLLHRHGHTIASVVSRSLSSARRLGRLVRCRSCSQHLSDVSSRSDLLILATPDEAIEETARGLSSHRGLNFQHLCVFHTSGVLSSDELRSLAGRGATVFSLHPIQTFSKSVSLAKQLEVMKGVWYGFEGDRKGAILARALVADLGGKLLKVPKEEKILYHLACVLVSNYPVALMGAVEDLTMTYLEGDIRPFQRLLLSSLDNALTKGASQALTGPIRRGSAEVLKRHREELKRKAPELLSLYDALGMYALKIAQRSGKLTDEQVRLITGVLTGNRDR